MKADSARTIFYALGANLAIAAAKTAAAVATGSSAMLAEAIHSFADSGNQGLLLWGMKQAKRPPSADYPLGSIAIGAVLIVVAIGIGVQIKGLLIGRSADPEVEARMREFLQRREEIDHLYRMLTLQLGTSLMVAVKARMKAREAAELVDAI